MENKKKAKVDYAAIIREFEMYGRGRSIKQFCDDSSYVYPNVLYQEIERIHLNPKNGCMPARCLKGHGIRLRYMNLASSLKRKMGRMGRMAARLLGLKGIL
jgi:hypothetical protein